MQESQAWEARKGVETSRKTARKLKCLSFESTHHAILNDVVFWRQQKCWAKHLDKNGEFFLEEGGIFFSRHSMLWRKKVFSKIAIWCNINAYRSNISFFKHLWPILKRKSLWCPNQIPTFTLLPSLRKWLYIVSKSVLYKYEPSKKNFNQLEKRVYISTVCAFLEVRNNPETLLKQRLKTIHKCQNSNVLQVVQYFEEGCYICHENQNIVLTNELVCNDEKLSFCSNWNW